MAEKKELNAELPNPLAQIKVDELAVTNKMLQAALDAEKAKTKELTESLSALNDVVEADMKAVLVPKILANTKYKLEEVENLSLDEMRNIDGFISKNKVPYISPRTQEDDHENVTVPGNIFGQPLGPKKDVN